MEIKNQLLIKPDVGEVRRPNCILPDKRHTYGKAYKRESHGAGHLVSSWPEEELIKESAMMPDFFKMNKIAVINGISQSNKVSEFRKANPDILKPLKAIDLKN